MWAFYYFCIVSLVTGVTFALDKYKASHGKWRVPESTLHVMEAAGGVVAVLVLMYTIHHKNAKFSYYAITYLILIAWIVALALIWKYLL